MHLTSWLGPSPLGPGIAPWGGLADGAHATLSGQEVAQKPSPTALWQGGRARRGHAGHSGSKRKYLQWTHRRVVEGLPLSQAASGEREGRSRWHCHASHITRMGPPRGRARATPWRGR